MCGPWGMCSGGRTALLVDGLDRGGLEHGEHGGGEVGAAGGAGPGVAEEDEAVEARRKPLRHILHSDSLPDYRAASGCKRILHPDSHASCGHGRHKLPAELT